MKKKRFGAGVCLLLAIGLLCALISLGALLGTPDSLQYIIAAPDGEADLQRALNVKKETAEQLADCTSAVAVGATTEAVSVSAEDGSATATVYAVGEGWFEIYPVFMADGRRLTETELRQGEPVALLDSDLAFCLFGSELPPDAQARIGETQYRIVGTVRHRRSVGEAQAHCAYLPLLSAPQAQRDTLMIAAKPAANSGARTMFESVMRSAWRGDGCFYSIHKEALRQTTLPRVLLLLFGLCGIAALLRRMNRLCAKKTAAYREKLRHRYFKDTLPALAGLGLTCLLGYGAILALLYALVAFSAQMLTVFTEWVPENFVELSSLQNVFWNLTNSAAKLVKVGSRELRRIEFFGRTLRWGVIAILCSAALLRRTSRRSN